MVLIDSESILICDAEPETGDGCTGTGWWPQGAMPVPDTADTANRADEELWSIMNNLTISNNDHADGTWVSLCFLSFRKDVQQFLLVILNAAFSLEVSTRSSSSSAAKGRVEIGSDKMKQLLKETMRWVWAESCFRCYVLLRYKL